MPRCALVLLMSSAVCSILLIRSSARLHDGVGGGLALHGAGRGTDHAADHAGGNRGGGQREPRGARYPRPPQLSPGRRSYDGLGSARLCVCVLDCSIARYACFWCFPPSCPWQQTDAAIRKSASLLNSRIDSAAQRRSLATPTPTTTATPRPQTQPHERPLQPCNPRPRMA